MLLKGLKMQMNCGGVSAGEGTAETTRRAAGEEITGGGGGQGFDPLHGGSGIEAGEAGGFDGGGEFGDEQRRSEGAGGVVKGLVL